MNDTKFLDLLGLQRYDAKIKNWTNTNKQDKLVSGTNIKTINGNSLLGSGDITISGGNQHLYQHNITIANYDGMGDKVHIVLYTSSNVQFTFTTLRDYLINNGYKTNSSNDYLPINSYCSDDGLYYGLRVNSDNNIQALYIFSNMQLSSDTFNLVDGDISITDTITTIF